MRKIQALKDHLVDKAIEDDLKNTYIDDTISNYTISHQDKGDRNYEKFKYPSNLNEAFLHQKASGIGESIYPLEECQCCGRAAKKSFSLIKRGKKVVHEKSIHSEPFQLLEVCPDSPFSTLPGKPASLRSDEGLLL